MLCNICKKHPATVHLTEIINERVTKLHLCEECAKKKGAEMESHFGLSELLASLADYDKATPQKDAVRARCPKCGLTYNDFRKIGRLGCAQCYVTFKEFLVPLLKRIHGSSQHLGKLPVGLGVLVKEKTELQELKTRLQRAVQLEEFEEAARLRDRIKEVEGGLKKRKKKDDAQ